MQNLKENSCVWVSFKVNVLRSATFFKQRLRHRCFSVNFVKFLRTATFIEHFRRLILPKLISMSLTSTKSSDGCFNCIYLRHFPWIFLRFSHKILSKQRSINIAFLLDISRKSIKRKSHSKITVDDVTGSGLVSEVQVNFNPFFERLLLTGGLYIIWCFMCEFMQFIFHVPAPMKLHKIYQFWWWLHPSPIRLLGQLHIATQ